MTVVCGATAGGRGSLSRTGRALPAPLGRAVLSLLLTAVLGCGGEELPQLYPVTGKVVKGGQPVTGGTIRFTPVGVPERILINAPVHEDGTFQLSTRKGNTRAPGAPEGMYEVMYSPAKLVKGGPLPVSSSKTYKVKPQPNEFTFDVAGEHSF